MSKNKDCSPVIPQRNIFKESFEIKEPKWTEKQKKFIDLFLDKNTKIVFLNGPAGTSKTFISIFLGLKLIQEKKVSDIIYCRTVIESASKGLGYLPGESEDKFAPFMMPLMDKMDELVSKADAQKLKNDQRIQAIPINYLRGANFNKKCILADESQNFTFKELTTLITRFGKFSKMIVCGDTKQSDINGNSGFKSMFDLFNDENSRQNGIYALEFGIEDVLRSEEVKFILEKLDIYNSLKAPKGSNVA